MCRPQSTKHKQNEKTDIVSGMDKLPRLRYQRLDSAHLRIIVYLGLTILFIFACLSWGRAVHFTFFSPLGGIDFYGFWRAGLFLRQGSDPYTAFLLHLSPNSPITFLDGSVYEQLPYDDQLSIAPTNTAPSLFIFYLFAWLPWPLAKTSWFLFNGVLAAILPLLLVQLHPATQRWPRILLLALFLIFYSLKSVRGALGTGQTTILVVTLMTICLLVWQKHEIVAGLALGIALSKYSVALPLLLYALYERRLRVVVVGALVQLGAVVALGLLTHRSPVAIVWNYYLIMQQHWGQPGLHLAELFAPGTWARSSAPVLLTLGFVIFAGWLRFNKQARSAPPTDRQFYNLHVFSALALWTLLVAYHRPYDGMLIMFFVVLILLGLSDADGWRLTSKGRSGVLLALVFSVAIFILPYEEIGSLLPPAFADQALWLIAKSVILTLLGMFLLNLWLLNQVTRTQDTER
ncbi:MAG: DUF2029 domain-containing protein [Caldilinea sp. CFX5]|nr:DUF2029 domain-containing protein [Caldilinea sp. CFX5]